jgi:2-amino-4-hydroxy-6-hydroxymethyldihydropteridine diphosphokinase
MAEAYLELGSNLGDREAYLARALEALSEWPDITIRRTSRVYRSSAWGVLEQPDFLNLCVQIDTELDPFDLLQACKMVEVELGRQERARWGPREIDVDILMMDDVDIETPGLTIPHARLSQRRFVLEPLAEIAPDREFDGLTISRLADALREDAPEQVCEVDPDATAHVEELLRRGAGITTEQT